MNPNNNNLEYLLKLPTPRLLQVYRKFKRYLSRMDDLDWAWFESKKKELSSLSPGEEVPKFFTNKAGCRAINPLYLASKIQTSLEFSEKLKKELDCREHIPNKRREHVSRKV